MSTQYIDFRFKDSTGKLQTIATSAVESNVGGWFDRLCFPRLDVAVDAKLLGRLESCQ